MRILIVCEGHSARYNQRLTIEQAGFEVDSTESPETALVWLETVEYAAFVIGNDVQFFKPEALARRIRTLFKYTQTPILVVGGDSDSSTLLRQSSFGITRAITSVDGVVYPQRVLDALRQVLTVSA